MDEFQNPAVVPLEDEPLEEFIHLDDQIYQLNSMRDLIDSFRFKLGTKKVAISRFGGTLAICRDVAHMEFYELSDPLRDHICFYSNHGLFQNKIRFESNTRIVGFDFLYDELLVVVLESGEYFVIDPFEPNLNDEENSTNRMSQFDFGRNFKEDLIAEAKVFRNGLVFQTKTNKFYYKTDLLESQLEEFKYTSDMGSELACWAIIAPEYAHFELQIANPTSLGGGILCLSEDVTRTHVQYNGFDPLFFDDTIKVNLQNVRAIASNDNGEWIAYLAASGQYDDSGFIVHIISTNIDNEGYKQIQVQLPKGSQVSVQNTPVKMYWVETHCVALHILDQLFLVGSQGSILVTSDFNLDQKTAKRSSFVCCQEIDCVKIVTQSRIVLLRRTPPAYLRIFQQLSQEQLEQSNSQHPPAKRLYDESISKKDRMDISSNEDIRNSPEELREAIEECIIAGGYELRRSRQHSLLKAASFGKIFAQGHSSHSNQFESDSAAESSGEVDLTTVCKFLRVSYQLNNQKYSRTLTFAQVQYLEEKHPDVLIKIMLRYNYHYIAMQVVNFLHLHDKYKSIVYMHWARCKIEKNEPDDVICSAIQKKLQGEPNISFTDIAHKALQHGKPQIALKLLVDEPCIQKRIPVLLWMAKYLREAKEQYFEKALNEALLSKDSSLVYLVIRTIWEEEEQKGEKCFAYFAKDEVLSMHFIKFLRSVDSSNYKQLYSYLISQKQSIKAGFFLLEQAQHIKKHAQMIQLMEEVKKEFIKETKDRFYFFMVDEYIKLLKNCDETTISTSRKSSMVLGAVNSANLTQTVGRISLITAGEKELSVSSHLTQLFAQKQDRAIAKVQSDLKLTDKRLNFCKLKALIEATPPDPILIDQAVEQINRKGVEIPYEMIIDTLLRRGGLESLAMRMADRISDPDNHAMYQTKIANYTSEMKTADSNTVPGTINQQRQQLPPQSNNINNNNNTISNSGNKWK